MDIVYMNIDEMEADYDTTYFRVPTPVASYSVERLLLLYAMQN